LTLTDQRPATDNAYDSRESPADAGNSLSDAPQSEVESQQLREFAPTFLSDLLEELARQAAAFSASVKDRRFRIYASTGPYGARQTMVAFGNHAGTYFSPPAEIVQLSDRADQLVQRRYTSQVAFRETVLLWEVREDRIQILKKGEVQTLESFSAELIEDFLKRFAR
jgi:hypothetical protein